METIWWNALICLFVRTNLDGKEKLFDRSFVGICGSIV